MKWTIDILENVDNYLSPKIQNKCSVVDSHNGQQNLLQKCAISLCGKPKDGITSALLDFNFDKYVKPEKFEQFSDVEVKIKEIVLNESSKNDQFLKAFKEKISNEFDLDFSNWEDWEYDNLTYKFFDKYISFESNKKLPLENRISYKLDLPPNASEILKKGIKSYAESKINKNLNSFIAGIYDDLYTIDEGKEILRQKWDFFLKNYNASKVEKPNLLDDKQEELNSIKLLVNNNSFSDLYSIGSVANKIFNLTNNLEYQKTGVWPEFKATYKCSSEDCKKAMQEEIKKIDVKDLLVEFEKSNKDKKKLVNDKVAYCKSEFAMKTLKDYNKSEFLNIIPQIKRQFTKNVFKNYSVESKLRFEEYLNHQLNISVEKKAESSQEFLNDINIEYKSFKSSNINDNQYENRSSKDLFIKLLDHIDFNNEINPLGKIHVCSNFLSFSAWDAFSPQEEIGTILDKFSDIDPTKDNLFISMFSCTQHSHGKGIVSHELGHALSWFFSEKKLSKASYTKYQELRSCATNLYKVNANETVLPLFNHAGDKYRSEEDMADLISYLANPDQKTLFECSLLKPSTDGEFFNDLELFNSFEIDSHSAPLLRVLQEAIHKRVEMPLACSQVINQNKNSFRFEPCF